MKRGRTKVAVLMSGGVDSSVAAHLLKEEGYDVVGITYKFWTKNNCGTEAKRACCSLKNIEDAREVAHRLGVPHYVLDLSREFERDIIRYFQNEYMRGRTPNPCILCNEKIKFHHILKRARGLGASYVATGHYARIARKGSRYLLKEAACREKDQSYALFSLTQSQLHHILFPLGDLSKERVRRIAQKAGLPVHDKPDSQEICFTWGKDYRDFLRLRLKRQIKTGDIVFKDGTALGRHKGIPFYTVGQRHGLGIAYQEPLYVLELDTANNRLIVGTDKDRKKEALSAAGATWIAHPAPKRPFRAEAKVRYSHRKQEAFVRPLPKNRIEVFFERPQDAVTPGQAVVFYRKGTVLGGGWIEKAL